MRGIRLSIYMVVYRNDHADYLLLYSLIMVGIQLSKLIEWEDDEVEEFLSV